METLFFILVLLIFAGLGYLIYMLKNQSKTEDTSSQKLFLDLLENMRKELHDSTSRSRQEILENTNKTRQEMQTQLERVNEQLSRGMLESTKTMQTQFKQSADIIKEVTSKLTKLDETNKQVVSFAEQMKSLENILTNPKQRGILGEYFLETLLANVLPPNQYKMQYGFKNGEIVDAAIFFKDKIIPIDAKFSLENYNRLMQENDAAKREKMEKEFKGDIKNRIDETSKYIRPEENTTDFAFMFIPAEGIYYNLLIYKTGTVEINTHDLIEYAFKKHVIIVSPTSFYAYLETVLQGLKALEMEASVKEVIKKVGELSKHLNAYQSYMQKLGNHLGTTVSMYNNATQEFRKIDKDVVKISGGAEKIEVELEMLEKPHAED
jgi:DNA recombination protein RmuC